MLSNKDIAVDSHINPTMIRITLRQSKTDVFGAGVEIYLGRTNSIVCPVKALLAYLALRPPTPSPLFILQSGVSLSREVLVASIREVLISFGLQDVSQFNGHVLELAQRPQQHKQA